VIASLLGGARGRGGSGGRGAAGGGELDLEPRRRTARSPMEARPWAGQRTRL
jgi:hypothetical protein